MTVAEVEGRLAEIAEECSDFEVAHGLEDALHSDVLRAIAEGADFPRELAAAALRSHDIDFSRHCS